MWVLFFSAPTSHSVLAQKMIIEYLLSSHAINDPLKDPTYLELALLVSGAELYLRFISLMIARRALRWGNDSSPISTVVARPKLRPFVITPAKTELTPDALVTALIVRDCEYSSHVFDAQTPKCGDTLTPPACVLEGSTTVVECVSHSRSLD
jgi:hypothetical protein